MVSEGKLVDGNPVLPVYLICDTSQSMLCLTEEGNKRIDVLNEAITNLFVEILNLNETTSRVEVCVISFNDSPHLVLPLQAIDPEMRWEPLKPGGKTEVAKALKFFNERLSIDEKNRAGLPSCRPVAFIITDGEPTDREAQWKKECERLASEHSLAPRIIPCLVAEPSDKLIETITVFYGKDLSGVSGQISTDGKDIAQAIRSTFNEIAVTLNLVNEDPKFTSNLSSTEYIEQVDKTMELTFNSNKEIPLESIFNDEISDKETCRIESIPHESPKKRDNHYMFLRVLQYLWKILCHPYRLVCHIWRTIKKIRLGFKLCATKDKVTSFDENDSFSEDLDFTDSAYDEEIDSSPLSLASEMYPPNIGGTFSEVEGQMTSTTRSGPAVALDSGNVFSGLIELRAASLIGDLHIEEGLKRQDAYAVYINHDARCIEIAVCDGVGSRTKSDEGANLVARTVVNKAASKNANPVQEARSLLYQLSKFEGLSPIEYSTTLIWLKITVGIPGEPWKVRFVQYGDSDVRFLRIANKEWYRISRDYNINEGNTNSFSLPLADRPSYDGQFFWMPGDVLVVATDGLTHHLDSRTKVGYYLANSWDKIIDRWEFLNTMTFRTRGAGDDRTAIILWRTDNEANSYL